jgi:hypothetical protein
MRKMKMTMMTTVANRALTETRAAILNLAVSRADIEVSLAVVVMVAAMAITVVVRRDMEAAAVDGARAMADREEPREEANGAIKVARVANGATRVIPAGKAGVKITVVAGAPVVATAEGVPGLVEL